MSLDPPAINEQLFRAEHRLPSLAQQGRVKQLDQPRWFLWFIGILFILAGALLIGYSEEIARRALEGQHQLALLDKQKLLEAEQFARRAVSVCGGLVIALGIAYLLFGALVKRFPGPIIIMTLVMSLSSSAVVFALPNESADEAHVQGILGLAVLLSPVFALIVVLGKSLYSAVAFERERRHQERLQRKRAEQASDLEWQTGMFAPRGDRRSFSSERDRSKSFREDAWPIKSILWLFGIMLLTSIFYSWYIQFGEKDVAGGDDETGKSMLVVEIIDTVLVMAAIAIVGRPSRIRRRFTTRLAAWCIAAPVLALVLGQNLLYSKVIQDYLGKHPHPELMPMNFESHFWLVLVGVCIQPAVVEEIFFRYLALGHLRKILRDHGAVWVTAVMFGFVHLFNPVGIPVLIIVGLALGYLRVMSGGMLLPMLMHGCHNAVVLLLEGNA